MIKNVIDLTTAEQEIICDEQKRRNKTDRPRSACDTCPLRWVNHCTLCVCLMPNALVARMHNAIGNDKVNLEHYQEIMEVTNNE